MKTPGDLVQSADYALAFRRLEPLPDRPRRLLVLLHGWGSDETQLVELGACVRGDMVVVFPRGPRSAGEDGFGWYRVSFGNAEPEAHIDEMEASFDKLVEFIGQLQSHHGIEPSRTIITGFSQGGALASRVALAMPGCVAGFAMIGGRILHEPEAMLAPREALTSLRALIVHGCEDAILPPEHAAHSAATLHRLGIAHDVRLHDAAHAATTSMQVQVADWLDDPRQPWNA
jgi:phospholipase/carboxylesterase